MWTRTALGLATVVAVLTAVPGSSPATAQTCAPPGPGDAGAPVGVATPPVAAIAQDTDVRWTRVTTRVPYGETALLQGQVVAEDGAVPDASVRLEARTADSGWTSVRSTTSDPETGVFSFGCLQLAENTAYRALYDGTPFYGSSSARHDVGVARRVPDAMRQVGPSRFTYRGAVDPRYAGPVVLQRRDCPSCAWRDRATTSADADSAWRFRIDVAALRGEFTYRAVVPGDRRFVRSLSDRTWTITAR